MSQGGGIAVSGAGLSTPPRPSGVAAGVNVSNVYTFATLPNGGATGNICYTSDQGLCQWNGTAWVSIGGLGVNQPNGVPQLDSNARLISPAGTSRTVPAGSANAFWLGKKATGQQGAPQGFFYDVTNLLPAFNLSNKYVAGAGTTPDIYSTNDTTLHLSNPLAQPVFNFTTTIGMSAFQGGIVLLEPSSISQVFTLPQITASGTLGNKSDGLPFTLINPGTQATPQTCTVVSNGTTGTGQSIYSSAAAGVAKSTITLVSGASCQIVAVHNNANNTSFWYVIANNGATFS